MVSSGVVALAAAELAARLLTPRKPLPPPEPVRLEDHFAPEQISRARRYSRPQMVIGLAHAAVDGAALVAVARWRATRPSRKVQTQAAVAGSAAQAALLSLALSVPGLPLSALARRRSLAVGLSTQSWRAWTEDLLKASLIQAGFAALGGAAVTGAARRWPRGWWLPTAAGSVVFGAGLAALAPVVLDPGLAALAPVVLDPGLAALAPVVLDPIFNEFTPLPEGDTRDDVLALARAADVKVGEVYSVDASRRTTAANAYVTGLGPSKRVVLFDTLLEKWSRDEIRVVVAHELAHVRHRDVLRGLAFAALTAPATAFAMQRLSWALSPERGSPGALPALALSAGIVSFPVGLISTRLTRAIERQADDFSLRLSDAPEAFVGFERTLVQQNVADPAPPRIFNVLSTHPPTAERIGAALAYQKGRPTRAAQ